MAAVRVCNVSLQGAFSCLHKYCSISMNIASLPHACYPLPAASVAAGMPWKVRRSQGLPASGQGARQQPLPARRPTRPAQASTISCGRLQGARQGAVAAAVRTSGRVVAVGDGVAAVAVPAAGAVAGASNLTSPAGHGDGPQGKTPSSLQSQMRPQTVNVCPFHAPGRAPAVSPPPGL